MAISFFIQEFLGALSDRKRRKKHKQLNDFLESFFSFPLLKCEILVLRP
jgi:hypothetical protein